MAADGLYSTGRVAQLVGVCMRTVDSWATNGLAPASIRAAGVGSDRWYRFDDLVVVKAMAVLRHETDIPLRRLVAQAIRREPTAETVEVKSGPIVTLFVNVEKIRVELRTALMPSSPKSSAGGDDLDEALRTDAGSDQV
jgi:DNA-binding transcriptional MerR regulator